MENKLFIGNLAFTTSEESLRSIFSEVGGVSSVAVVTDKATGRARGFGFIEMESAELASKAIEAFNGKEYDGRPIVVSLAKPKAEGERSFGSQRRNY